MRDDGSVGVYVHVPFCERVCPYCDFAVVATRRLAKSAQEDYVDGVLRELEVRRADFAERWLASVYLGGGTPALLRPEAVRRLVEAVRGAFPTAPSESAASEPEVTLELNPSTVERGRLPGFRAAGVGRLSIGVQSFHDELLKRLGRAQAADQARATLRAARDAGFRNVSLDLIFGVPGQSLAQLERDLAELVAFEPEHVSAYELSVEEGTPYALAVERGQLALPAEEDALRMHALVGERLGAAGYQSYEISSHAKPGFASLHNRRYWQRRPVLGLGMGAWSLDPPHPAAPHGSRRANVRQIPIYLERVREGRSPADAPVEVLDARTARGEALFLALRTQEGLDAAGFAKEFGAPPRHFFAPEIDELAAAGLLLEDGSGGLRLTGRGRMVSDSVFERFV